MHGRSRLLFPIARVVIQEEHTNGRYEFVENFQTYDGCCQQKAKKVWVVGIKAFPRWSSRGCDILNGMKIQ